MVTIVKNIEEADYVTHAGNFHADDVLGTVFLEKLYDNVKLIRLKEYKDDGRKIAYDIGLGKFDHHQAGYNKKRENGIHYCGFGLLWQEYGRDYLKKINVDDIEKTFKVFDYLLVNMIDAFDNGEYSINSDFNIYTVSGLIELFRAKFDEDKDENECFLEAVKFGSIIFDLVIKEAISKVKQINIIKDKAKNVKDKILILDEFVPYEYAIFKLNLEVDFVVYPSTRGGYAAHTVSTYYKGFTPRVPFNKNWAGLRDEELQKVSGIKTAKFCHNKLFLVTAETKEDVLKLIYLSK
ncbi:MAG: MYG1 family protein [Firmicutes bacterium]|nr:MYG1 family protein [Bacillota bacterium]